MNVHYLLGFNVEMVTKLSLINNLRTPVGLGTWYGDWPADDPLPWLIFHNIHIIKIWLWLVRHTCFTNIYCLALISAKNRMFFFIGHLINLRNKQKTSFHDLLNEYIRKKSISFNDNDHLFRETEFNRDGIFAMAYGPGDTSIYSTGVVSSAWTERQCCTGWSSSTISLCNAGHKQCSVSSYLHSKTWNRESLPNEVNILYDDCTVKMVQVYFPKVSYLAIWNLVIWRFLLILIKKVIWCK